MMGPAVSVCSLGQRSANVCARAWRGDERGEGGGGGDDDLGGEVAHGIRLLKVL